MFLVKFLSVLSLLCVSFAFPAANSEARALSKRAGSMCDTSQDNLTAILPSDINTRGGRPLLAPIGDAPTFTTLSVGVQNYTCLPNGTWT